MLPIASLVQFPWRLLGLASLAMAIVAGAAVRLGSQRRFHPGSGPCRRAAAVSRYALGHRYPGRGVRAVLWWSCLGLLRVHAAGVHGGGAVARDAGRLSLSGQFSPADRVAMVAYTNQTNGLPLEDEYMAGVPLQAAAVLSGQGVLQVRSAGGASSEVRVRAETPVTVQFYTCHYPGWQVTLNGVPLPHRNAPPYCLVTVDVLVGDHQLMLRMGTTAPRTVGGIASLVACVLMIALVIRPAKRMRG